MLICLGDGGILGLHDLRIVPLKPDGGGSTTQKKEIKYTH
jgi:hypothetical protein